ncbi:hypothetical protein HZB01_05740 [Candidatus Woesearchaeota archaeon]|nr:hypothetical protein [Candidatus Woesearchaeota archaeon]
MKKAIIHLIMAFFVVGCANNTSSPFETIEYVIIQQTESTLQYTLDLPALHSAFDDPFGEKYGYLHRTYILNYTTNHSNFDILSRRVSITGSNKAVDYNKSLVDTENRQDLGGFEDVLIWEVNVSGAKGIEESHRFENPSINYTSFSRFLIIPEVCNHSLSFSCSTPTQEETDIICSRILNSVSITCLEED